MPECKDIAGSMARFFFHRRASTWRWAESWCQQATRNQGYPRYCGLFSTVAVVTSITKSRNAHSFMSLQENLGDLGRFYIMMRWAFINFKFILRPATIVLVIKDFAYCLSIACTISSIKDKILEEVQYHFHLSTYIICLYIWSRKWRTTTTKPRHNSVSGIIGPVCLPIPW